MDDERLNDMLARLVLAYREAEQQPPPQASEPGCLGLSALCQLALGDEPDTAQQSHLGECLRCQRLLQLARKMR